MPLYELFVISRNLVPAGAVHNVGKALASKEMASAPSMASVAPSVILARSLPVTLLIYYGQNS
jgi:hypothetical protein